MTTLEWTLTGGLGLLYLALLFTVAMVTFQKKHIWLFIGGFIFPILWLVGAMLKPKPGSHYKGPLA